ncbi:MAG: nitrogen fixation protein NifH [Chloroflexota bacterium]|nr:MAG: nitrogen fixation protein NifH [Chloroflexota bacterium]
MTWQEQLKGDSLTWLLEPETPGARYLTLRDLLDCASDDPELQAARRAAHEAGPIAGILAEMEEDGFWARPGPGYNPKYRSSVWSLILLAQLGASPEEDERIGHACAYLLEHGLAAGGQFTASGAPSGTADCLQGNMCWAFLELGYDDPRLDTALEWMARTVTGEVLAPNSEPKAPLRFYASQCGPTFACGSNNKLPCAWGGVKVMLAFSKLPAEERTPLIDRAIQHGIDFLFSVDPAEADYPTGWTDKPSRNWWKFGFPVFYITDLLQNVEALVALGYGRDPRLINALEIIREKQDDLGRWALDYHYTGKTWLDFGEKRQPNKWVTIRALRVLKAHSASLQG